MTENNAESMEEVVATQAHEPGEDVMLHPTGGYPVCGKRKKSDGSPCLNPAGKKTWHEGIGACFLHGGASPAGPYSKYLQHDKDIKERVKELKTDPELLDLRNQVALIVAVLEKAVDELNKDSEGALGSAKDVSVISTNLARVVEVHHKMMVGYYISPEKQELILKILAGQVRKTCADCPKVLDLADGIEQVEIPD